MKPEEKASFDAVWSVVGTVGAILAFVWAILQWRVSQKWKRAEQLDKFVELFEKDELLTVGRTIVDWTARKIMFRGEEVKIMSEDVLLALRLHESMGSNCIFPHPQPLIRDAYDTWLNFFQRLELAISSGLIERLPTKQYFGYWVNQFVTMAAHPGATNTESPKQLVRQYVDTYGDAQSLARLCQHFGIAW